MNKTIKDLAILYENTFIDGLDSLPDHNDPRFKTMVEAIGGYMWPSDPNAEAVFDNLKRAFASAFDPNTNDNTFKENRRIHAMNIGKRNGIEPRDLFEYIHTHIPGLTFHIWKQAFNPQKLSENANDFLAGVEDAGQYLEQVRRAAVEAFNYWDLNRDQHGETGWMLLLKSPQTNAYAYCRHAARHHKVAVNDVINYALNNYDKKFTKESADDFLAGVDSIDYERMANEAYDRWTKLMICDHPTMVDIFRQNCTLPGARSGEICKTVAKNNGAKFNELTSYIKNRWRVKRLIESEDFLRGIDSIDFRTFAKEAFEAWKKDRALRNPLSTESAKLFFVDNCDSYNTYSNDACRVVAQRHNIKTEELIAYIKQHDILENTTNFLSGVDDLSKVKQAADKAFEGWWSLYQNTYGNPSPRDYKIFTGQLPPSQYYARAYGFVKDACNEYNTSVDDVCKYFKSLYK